MLANAGLCLDVLIYGSCLWAPVDARRGGLQKTMTGRICMFGWSGSEALEALSWPIPFS